MKLKIKLSGLLLFVFTSTFAQIKDYRYKREIKNIDSSWHSVILPDDVFSKIQPNFSDLRVFGITKTDTLEAPYILQIIKDEILNKEADFKLINKTSTNTGFFYTFQIQNNETINQIKLQFNNKNFDYQVNLEGSHNQKNWFNILSDYRILAIKNQITDYKFTTLSFPNAKYNYFRLFIPAAKNPDFNSAKLSLNQIVNGEQKQYKIQSFKIAQNKENKQSIIIAQLAQAVPVSKLKISLNSKFDYYRPITISYITDSVKTEKGWIDNYSTLFTGTLSSIENNEFKFNSTILQKIKIEIDNQDNEPLKIEGVQLKGFIHKIIIRFNNPANYFLAYGSPNANIPNYDIQKFTHKIPSHLKQVTLEKQENFSTTDNKKTEPLFQNKIWLWAIMGIIMLLLLWFTLKMIKNK